MDTELAPARVVRHLLKNGTSNTLRDRVPVMRLAPDFYLERAAAVNCHHRAIARAIETTPCHTTTIAAQHRPCKSTSR